MIEQNDTILDIEAKLHHVITFIIKATTHKTDIALHLEIALPMTKEPLFHIIRIHKLTILKEISDLFGFLTDPRINCLIDMTLVKDTDLARILEIKTFPDIVLHSDYRQDQEIRDTLHLDHT